MTLAFYQSWLPSAVAMSVDNSGNHHGHDGQGIRNSQSQRFHSYLLSLSSDLKIHAEKLRFRLNLARVLYRTDTSLLLIGIWTLSNSRLDISKFPSSWVKMNEFIGTIFNKPSVRHRKINEF